MSFSDAMTGPIPIDPIGLPLYPPETEVQAMPPKEVPTPIVVSGPLAFITKSLGIHPWGQVLILALIGCGWFLYSRLGDINDHLAKNELQIQMMPLELSKQLLSQADIDLKFGRTERASRVMDVVTDVIAKASIKKIQPPEKYFSETLSYMNGMATSTKATPELLQSVQSARVMLLEYHSALEKPPYSSGNVKSFSAPLAEQDAKAIIDYNRMTLIFTLPPGKDMFDLQGPKLLSRNILVSGPVFRANGSDQTLDGVHWHNVVFVGAHIKYLGGELDLQNVRFVDCTFEIVGDAKGQQFIQYAALGEDKLTIS